MLSPGKCVTAKFWPYLGDWLHPYAVFDFTQSRARDGPAKFLGGFTGYLQADAYSGYDALYAGDSVQEVSCWVHARRYWHQAEDSDPLRANVAMSYIARLSQIETQLRIAYPRENLQGQRDFGAVAAARQEHSLPVLAEFKTWLKDLFTRLPYHRDGDAFEQATNGLPVESDELDYLLPDIWLAANPEHKWTIDQIRREERNRKSV